MILTPIELKDGFRSYLPRLSWSTRKVDGKYRTLIGHEMIDKGGKTSFKNIYLDETEVEPLVSQKLSFFNRLKLWRKGVLKRLFGRVKKK